MKQQQQHEPYEVGRFYMVPCVEGTWCGVQKFWPVIGPFHNDAEIIEFDEWHWHIDVRFISGSPYFHKNVQDVVREFPLMLTIARPNYSQGDYFTPAKHPMPVLKRRKCRRQYASHETSMDRARWLQKLEASCGSAGLRNGRCPHRGTDLSTMIPDEFGCIECPLHGLIFDAASGSNVPRAEWMRMRQSGMRQLFAKVLDSARASGN
jgi:hypothetical protein